MIFLKYDQYQCTHEEVSRMNWPNNCNNNTVKRKNVIKYPNISQDNDSAQIYRKQHCTPKEGYRMQITVLRIMLTKVWDQIYEELFEG